MSGRRLARAIDRHPSYIDHLLQGRCRTAKPVTAQRIAEALEVPLEILFVPTNPRATRHGDASEAA
jgi:predicted phosphoribosyltransferase